MVIENGTVEGRINEERDDKEEVETNTPPLGSSKSADFNPNENTSRESPNKTQVQESSSAAKPLVNRGEGTEEDKAKWISFLNSPRNSKPNTPNRVVSSKSPSYDPGSRSGSEESDSSEGSKDQDMVDLTTNEASSNIEEEPPYLSQEENEERFIGELMERNRNGELDTLGAVIRAMREIGGADVAELGVPVSFTARIALKLLQRSDPLGLLVKNQEESQNDMMQDQRKLFRDQMAYLHRKTLERVGADTKAMVAVMRVTLDTTEKELIALKAEHKSLILKHTLLSTEHTVMKSKHSPQGDSGDPLAQCQKDLVDWQNRYSAKDKETVEILAGTGIILPSTQHQ
jgi:hypothetical protein